MHDVSQQRSVPPPTPRAFGADLWSEGERVRRQAALPIDTAGDQLTAREIEFLEQFLAAGHQVEWIPRDHKNYEPTNDFHWLARPDDADHAAMQVELKSLAAKYKSISSEIKNDIDAARNPRHKNPPPKGYFIIDIGTRPLRDALRSQLAKFNARNPSYALDGLWVWSRGTLTRVDCQSALRSDEAGRCPLTF